jgi:large subunit ribosomal protein L25
MKTIEIKGSGRTQLGKKGATATRSQGLIPCTIYGIDGNVNFAATEKEVKGIIYTNEFKIATLDIDGKSFKCILKDVQYHPLTEKVLHVDFLKLIPNHAIKVEIPVRTFGVSPGVKVGGKLVQSLRKVKIKSTPENLIGELRIDISKMELGQTSRIRDIEVESNIEIMMNPSIPVVMIEIPRSLRSAQTAAAATTGKKK